MTRAEFKLLIEVALTLREIAPPDSQRRLDRLINALQDDESSEFSSTIQPRAKP